MKNSTLIFRSLIVIVLITGAAQYFTEISKVPTEQTTKSNTEVSTTKKNTSKTNTPQKSITKKTDSYNENIDYIIGKWGVAYNNDNFKGEVVYRLKKEGKIFNAYTYEYKDKAGNTEEAKNKSKILSITSFDGYNGKGIYEMEFEKQTYQVECAINMVDVNTFKVSYDYHGYNGVETWKRQ